MADGGRVLCSHLMRLRVDGASHPAEWANLEEIDAFGAVLAAERAWPTQVEVRIEAEGFAAPAYVQACRARETDFALTVEFLGGFRWSEEAWKPDHACPAPGKAKAATT